MSSFRDQIENFIGQELSPSALSDRVAEVAYNGLGQLLGSGQVSTQYEVDNAQLLVARSLGVSDEVVVHFSYVWEVVLGTILEMLGGWYALPGIYFRAEASGGLIAEKLFGNDDLAQESAQIGAKFAALASLGAVAIAGGVAGASDMSDFGFSVDPFAIFAANLGAMLGGLTYGAFGHFLRIVIDGASLSPEDFFSNRYENGSVSEIIITSDAPFNRRMDTQTGSHGDVLHFHHPAGVYEAAAQVIREQYGDMFDVEHLPDVNSAGIYVPKHADFNFVSPGIRITPNNLGV